RFSSACADGSVHRTGQATSTYSQADNMAFWRVPLDAQEIQVTRGTVCIIDDRCKGCGYCIEFCPKDILQFSDKFNRKGYHPPVVIKQGECVNCHYCEIICPEFAIFSVETDSAAIQK
ncbi:MAG: ferredoxin family protein, partial [Desulfobulbus sp.]